MRRYGIGLALSAIVLVLIAVAASRPTAQTDSCASCTPARLFRFDQPPSVLELCFQDSDTNVWTNAQIDSIVNGITTWQDFTGSNGYSLSFSSSHKTSSDSCSTNTDTVKLYWGTDLGPNEPAGTLGVAGSSQATIEFNSAYPFSMTFPWNDVGAHEFGHVLDFADVYTDGCAGSTVMWWMTQSLLSEDARCGDKIAVTSKYIGGNTSSDYDKVYGEDYCYDLYLIVYMWWFDGSDWHDGGYAAYYVGHGCDGPPY
jgi:hypothetical protein